MNNRLRLCIALGVTIAVGALIGCGSVGTSNTEAGLTASSSGEQRSTSSSTPTTATGAMITNKRPEKPEVKADKADKADRPN